MTAPFSAIEIEINHACNRRCSYCPNSVSKRKSTGVIDPALFSKILLELKVLSFSGRVSYDFYNEPLLHPDFEGVVAKTRADLPKAAIVVYTNGTLLTRERLENLLSLGVTEFIVTRHEMDEGYEFDGVFESLSSSARERVQYRGFRELKLTNRGGQLKHLGAEGLVLAPCHIPSMVVTVTVAGRVLPCFEDYDENLVMGNLHEESLLDIWNSGKFTRFRKDLRLGQRHAYVPCSGCNRVESLQTARA
ncbi:MAG: radical SAM/SPASM domain-containing protein [Bdellovibrionia bacterium]